MCNLKTHITFENSMKYIKMTANLGWHPVGHRYTSSHAILIVIIMNNNLYLLYEDILIKLIQSNQYNNLRMMQSYNIDFSEHLDNAVTKKCVHQERVITTQTCMHGM